MVLFFSFMFFLLQNQRTGGQTRLRVDMGGRGKLAGKGSRMNAVKIMHTHVGKCKNDTS
jgi:hypothetical protein